MKHRTLRISHTMFAVFAVLMIQGCGVGVEPLMPTPVLYTQSGADPLSHIPEGEQWTVRRVFYATNRKRSGDLQSISYGNGTDKAISAGLALVQFGGPNMTWADLARDSNNAKRDEVVQLAISGILEAARFPIDAPLEKTSSAKASGWLIESINESIEHARDKDILVYVHGAQVNFYNSCVFAAQLDHFMGRDMTSVAFAWPTQQTILAYTFGRDIKRAYNSAEALATVLELLASETDARRVHLLSWSAGARIVTRALLILHERYPELSDEELRERFRLGTTYFAASDITIGEFIDALPSLHAITDRIIVTTTSDDYALRLARLTMGGGRRIGLAGASLSEEQLELLRSMDRLEVVNVSKGSDSRGFDITGHRYWFHHPWSSSDVIMSIRTDLLPHERGLVQDGEKSVWYMPDDYPQRLSEVIEGTEILRK